MSEEKIKQYEAQLKKLRQENEQLKQKLNSSTVKEEEWLTFKVFDEARKKFLGWIGIITVVITAFGFVSITSIISSVKEEIQKQGVKGVIRIIKNDIRKDIEKNHLPQLLADTREALKPQINAMMDELERNASIQIAKKIEEALSETTEGATLQQTGLVKAVQQSFEQDRYSVIAGSSPRKRNLEDEIQRVKEAAGSDFDELFGNVNIRKWVKSSKNYVIVVDSNLTYNAAQKLRKQALNIGFRSDTFIRKER